MDPIDQIQQAVGNEIAGLNLQYLLEGVVVPPHDVANKSGFLPFLFEQQQILADLIGVPENFQPKAFGAVVEDETALLGKTLQVKSGDAVVPLISYLTDAARMTERLAVNRKVDLGKLLNPDPDAPRFLSVVLDQLVNVSGPADNQGQDFDPGLQSQTPEP